MKILITFEDWHPFPLFHDCGHLPSIIHLLYKMVREIANASAPTFRANGGMEPQPRACLTWLHYFLNLRLCEESSKKYTLCASCVHFEVIWSFLEWSIWFVVMRVKFEGEWDSITIILILYFKMIPILVEAFRKLHSFHSNATKNIAIGNLLVRSASKQVINPELLNTCALDARRWENIGTQAIHRDHWSFYLYLSQCRQLQTLPLCKKLYIGETGRRLGDRFLELHLDVEKDNKDVSKPVARHFNLLNHSKQRMAVCGLSLRQESKESRKTLEQNFIFPIGTLNPHGIKERFSFN